MPISPKNKYIPAGWTLNRCAFESRKAMTDAMSDPKYGKDQEYTELVAYMANQPFGEDKQVQRLVTGRALSAAMYPKADARKLEDAVIFREQTQKMFGDPRYATSPTYRREVEDWLRANSAAIEASPGFAIRDVNKTRNAVKVELGTQGDTTERIRDGIRQAKIDAAKVAAEEKKSAIDAGLAEQIHEVEATRRPMSSSSSSSSTSS